MTRDNRGRTSTSKSLNIDEVRLVSDLRIMHSKVDELHHIVTMLKDRHDEESIVEYADEELLADDIRRVDEIYQWYLTIKFERDKEKEE